MPSSVIVGGLVSMIPAVVVPRKQQKKIQTTPPRENITRKEASTMPFVHFIQPEVSEPEPELRSK